MPPRNKNNIKIMRYDYFLIWGNGVDKTREIVSEIRNNDNFDIILIKKLKTKNINKFVDDIYECDTVPIAHLRTKTQYLLKSKPNMIFILVKNQKPDEQIVGQGQFQHTQCLKINEMKKTIRNKFNPKFSDLKKQIMPLNVGVSHEHIIHASDYESQVSHVLNVVGLQNLSYFKRNDNNRINIPYYLTINNMTPYVVNIDSLKANILGKGLVHIKDTPHYKYLSGDKDTYENYFLKYFGKELMSDHFPESFDKLIDVYDPNYLKSFPIINSNGQILDGVHRIAIAYFNDQKTIQVIK